MQGRNLIIKFIAAFIETACTAKERAMNIIRRYFGKSAGGRRSFDLFKNAATYRRTQRVDRRTVDRDDSNRILTL